MTPEERAATRAANLKIPPKRRRRSKIYAVGDPLPKLSKTHKSLGIVSVRKMIVGAIQQQVETLRNRYLGEADRAWLLQALKELSTVEKVAKQPNNAAGAQGKGGETQGAPLPPLATKS